MVRRVLLLIVAAVVIIGAAGYFGLVYKPEIAARDTAAPVASGKRGSRQAAAASGTHAEFLRNGHEPVRHPLPPSTNGSSPASAGLFLQLARLFGPQEAAGRGLSTRKSASRPFCHAAVWIDAPEISPRFAPDTQPCPLRQAAQYR